MARKSQALTDRRSGAAHESFLRHRGFFYLKYAAVVSVCAIAVYALTDPTPRHNGGTWLGYTLGVVSALLIVWLTLLGLRKRAITAGRWSLKGWTSAHIYLGLSLIVLATLHTGFQFGWNVHTLAYALMMIVIVSGAFGVYFYATIPQRMSDNRAEKSTEQMLEEIAALDDDLREAAQPLSGENALLVQRAIERTRLGGGVLERLRTSHPQCASGRALAALKAQRGGSEDVGPVTAVLERKIVMLERARRHIRYRALLELWLYIHVPATFGLLAALIAHIVSVFFFW
ncbi:MAG: hypothetical protein NW200_06265 [Hyphomonadaceae bacterium]|nr:hypothetical protein [Hyphomonadaceae bacterium]